MPGTRKGEGGAHWHALVRPERRTAVDGPHHHAYLIGDKIVLTENDGLHHHPLEAENADVILASDSSAHAHAVVIDGEVKRTEVGGQHAHVLQTSSTGFDGPHTHELVVGEQRYTSLTPGQFWVILQEHRAMYDARQIAERLERRAVRNGEHPVGKALESKPFEGLPDPPAVDEVLVRSDPTPALATQTATPADVVETTPAAVEKKVADEPDSVDADPYPDFELGEVGPEDVDKRMARPFGSPGGKRDQLKELLKRIPKHRVYVEPYAGSATLFWAKDKSEVEVLSDLDSEIMDTFRFLQKGSDSDFEWMRAQNWKASQAQFSRLKNGTAKSLRGIAYRFKYLNLFSKRRERQKFDRSRRDGNVRATGHNFLTNLERYRERLKGVKLLSEDALKVIKRYDAADAFLYVDPPWKDVGNGLEAWKGFNKEAFVKSVGGIKSAKVLVSYQGGLDELVKSGSWRTSKIEFQTTGFNQAKSTQDLVANYSRTAKASDVEKLLKAARAPGGRWPNTAQDAAVMRSAATSSVKEAAEATQGPRSALSILAAAKEALDS